MITLHTETIVTQPIARAYLERLPAIVERFQQSALDAEFCTARSRHGASRSRLVDLATLSMRGLERSTEQRTALNVLRDPQSVVAVTGQQVGLLGGPMYTIYKIRTAVEESLRVTAATGVATVPIFWLEDNDHDAAEAATAHILDSNQSVADLLAWDGENARLSVADRVIDDAMVERVVTGMSMLTGQFAEPTRERYRMAYQGEVSWTDAFLRILQPYLAAWGVLVIRGSDVIRSGLHLPILLRDVESPGELASLATQGTTVVEDLGFRAQATVGAMMFFGSDESGRQKCVIDGDIVTMGTLEFSRHDLVTMAKEHPERFTPTVLARPIIQDAILPTVVSVLGAAEIAYQAQLRECYQSCGVTAPRVVLRNGATLLDSRTERLLSKDEYDVQWYMRSTEEVDRNIADKLTADVLPDVAIRSSALDALIAPYLQAAEAIDQTLIAFVRAQGAGITSTLEAMEGKLRSAAKKQQAQVLDRVRAIHTIVWPTGTLQERVYPLAFWEARFGTVDLRIIVEMIARGPIGTHAVIGPSDLPTQG
ncbi:MAG: bacillithiol biosynthesis cysteine-adding enzyme BshC [Candidatus Kapabacteria bacterium]|nr:bacillithiol biosynthesis cysteine-adding enzyme BshC [Candidatus Kapabacteria bacterium]